MELLRKITGDNLDNILKNIMFENFGTESESQNPSQENEQANAEIFAESKEKEAIMKELWDKDEINRKRDAYPAIDIPEEECDLEIPAGMVLARYEARKGQADWVEILAPVVARINAQFSFPGQKRPADYNRDNWRIATIQGERFHIQGKYQPEGGF